MVTPDFPIARKSAVCAALLVALAGVPAGAHPHIFVDAGLEIVFDSDGLPHGLRIHWQYDEFFSMLLVSDLGLDPDFTGTVTADEREILDGFDMAWLEGYHGDTHVTQAGEPVTLSGPVEWTSDYRDGKLHSSHLRMFETTPDPNADWSVAIYDPTYYTSYALAQTPVITGRDDCVTRIFVPDWEQVESRLAEVLDEMLGSGADIEAEFPAVGEMFSEEVRVQCGAGS